jgi:hypothetical protein
MQKQRAFIREVRRNGKLLALELIECDTGKDAWHIRVGKRSEDEVRQILMNKGYDIVEATPTIVKAAEKARMAFLRSRKYAQKQNAERDAQRERGICPDCGGFGTCSVGVCDNAYAKPSSFYKNGIDDWPEEDLADLGL